MQSGRSAGLAFLACALFWLLLGSWAPELMAWLVYLFRWGGV
jgi:hypothetical protein